MSDLMDVSRVSESAATEDAPLDTAATAAAEPHPAAAKFAAIGEKLSELEGLAKAATALHRQLGKDMKKLCKKRRKSPGTPSNLMKPVALSPELCKFMGQPAGSSMTRGQVTKLINDYANGKSLKKPGNGRVIILDAPLASLLGLSKGNEVKHFSVQTHLKARNHYLKASE